MLCCSAKMKVPLKKCLLKPCQTYDKSVNTLARLTLNWFPEIHSCFLQAFIIIAFIFPSSSPPLALSLYCEQIHLQMWMSSRSAPACSSSAFSRGIWNTFHTVPSLHALQCLQPSTIPPFVTLLIKLKGQMDFHCNNIVGWWNPIPCLGGAWFPGGWSHGLIL